MQTPVVLLIFNRPDTTRRVLEVVRAARPSTLLVVADGPRPHVSSDEERCAETRALIDGVDWACDVRRNYADANMGLADRVAGGLTWAFEQVESAIILEDDCVPHPSFFRFCAELLDRYAADTRIMSISGTNYQLGRRRTDYSYYFSRYNHCWGWATWRRAWQFYDHDMTLWPDVRDGGWLHDILDSRQAARYWRKIFGRTYTGRINSWAYRWTLAHWLQSGLSILPNVNLVSNIGFGDQATHTRDRSPFAHMPAVAMPFPLSHPPFVIADAQADRHTQATVYREPPLPARALYRLRLLLAARQKSG